MRVRGLERTWTLPFVFLVSLALSYFYCLPLLRTGVVLGVTASEIRIYDVVFILGFIAIILPNITVIMKLWSKYSTAHKFLLVWLIIAFFGLFVTLIFKESRFLIGVIRYFRFFSFSIVFIIGFLFIKTRRQVELLYDMILVSIIVISIVGTMQGFGLLPNFWPEYYAIYWEQDEGYLATAILAPNHTHYSLVMAIGMVMAVARMRAFSRFGVLSVMLVAGLVPMLYSMLASKGRSGWLVLGVYLVYMLLFSRSNRFLIVMMMVLLGGFAYNNLDIKAGNTSVKDLLLYRSIATVKDTQHSALDALKDEETNIIQKVDASRWFIYASSMAFLWQNPQYLITGAGFQNASQGIGDVAVAAHNSYINVLAEHGIFGFAIYLYFLYSLFGLGARTRNVANTKESYFLATHWLGLFSGLLVANFFAEIIYPGRALFTFLGTFFVVTVVFLHPAWRNSST